jgi:GTP-binding protein LepA
LNDASLTWEPEASAALGFGFRCGFLGMLHMEIIQERLEREFNMTVITTVPNVSYIAYTTMGDVVHMHNPSDMPDPTKLDYIEEPFIKASIISKADFVGSIIKLCMEKRGIMINQTYLTTDRVELIFELPLGEIVFDFYDKLKSISKGYASFDYHPIDYRKSDLIKLDILINGDQVDALSALIHRSRAHDFGKKICEKLKELIPRQQFQMQFRLQSVRRLLHVRTSLLSAKTLLRNVTEVIFHVSVNFSEKQKEGKKRMRQIGSVEVPQSAFMAVLKLD